MSVMRADSGADAFGSDASAARDAAPPADVVQPADAAPPGDANHQDGTIVGHADAGDASGSGPSGWWPLDAAPPTDGAASTEYPAFLPDAPRVVKGPGHVLASPRFIPVVFAADAYQGSIDAFVSAVGGSDYWRAATAEYGVGPATSVAAIVVQETPPTSIDDALGIQPWLIHNLASDPRFGGSAVDGGFGDAALDAGWPDEAGSGALAEAVYVIFYPAATTITRDGGTSCAPSGFGGYHSHVTLPGGQQVFYAAIARCPPTYPLGAGTTLGGFDFVSAITSHEMAEAATDPGSTAYIGVDAQHSAWPGGPSAEVGDMCEGVRRPTFTRSRPR